MMLGLLVVMLLVALAGPSKALNYQDLDIPLQDYDVTDDVDDEFTLVSKRDLEFNQYVPSYRLRGEPTCDELRAMWRLSKREARRATSTNELPRARPYSYDRLMPFHRRIASGRHASYGSHTGAFNTLRAMLGPGAGPPGTFNRLRGLIRQESPGSSKGKYAELRKIHAKEMKQELAQHQRDATPIGQTVKFEDSMEPLQDSRHATVYYPTGSRRLRPSGGFVGDLLPANNPRPAISASWRPIPGDRGLRSCSDVRLSSCEQDFDCQCNGQFRCNKGKCKVLENASGTMDRHGSWYSAPVASEDLGVWSRAPRSQ